MAHNVFLSVRSDITGLELARANILTAICHEQAENVIELLNTNCYHMSSKIDALADSFREFFGWNEVTIIYMKEVIVL